MTAEKFLACHRPVLNLHAIKIGLMLGVDADDISAGGEHTICTTWAAKFETLADGDRLDLAKGIFFNTARNIRRGERRQSCHEMVGSLEDVGSQMADTSPTAASPLQEVLFREQRFEIYREIERLPRAYREAVALAALEFSRGEAASYLEITEGAYKNRLNRGRDRLKQQMSGRESEGGT